MSFITLILFHLFTEHTYFIMSFAICDKCVKKELSSFHSCLHLATCCTKEKDNAPPPRSIVWEPSKCDTCSTWLARCERSSLSALEKKHLLAFVRAVAERRMKRPVNKERIWDFFPDDRVANLITPLLEEEESSHTSRGRKRSRPQTPASRESSSASAVEVQQRSSQDQQATNVSNTSRGRKRSRPQTPSSREPSATRTVEARLLSPKDRQSANKDQLNPSKDTCTPLRQETRIELEPLSSTSAATLLEVDVLTPAQRPSTHPHFKPALLSPRPLSLTLEECNPLAPHPTPVSVVPSCPLDQTSSPVLDRLAAEEARLHARIQELKTTQRLQRVEELRQQVAELSASTIHPAAQKVNPATRNTSRTRAHNLFDSSSDSSSSSSSYSSSSGSDSSLLSSRSPSRSPSPRSSRVKKRSSTELPPPYRPHRRTPERHTDIPPPQPLSREPPRSPPLRRSPSRTPPIRPVTPTPGPSREEQPTAQIIRPSSEETHQHALPETQTIAPPEEDFRKVVYFLPQGAFLHPSPTDDTTTVEWGERRFYGFSLASVNPPAFSLRQPNQLRLYEAFLAECPLQPPTVTDPANRALLRLSEGLFRTEAVQNIGLSLGTKPNQISSHLPFAYIQNKVLPLFSEWLHPSPEAAFNNKKEQLKKIAPSQVTLQAITAKRSPTFPPPLIHLTNHADPLISFLQAPLPLSAAACSPLRKAAQLFSDPTPYSLAMYADYKHRALDLLSQILAAEAQLAGLNSLIEEGPTTEHKNKLRSVSAWSTFIRSSLEAKLKDTLRTLSLLHLQLRHEALDKQSSASVYSQLMNVEPFISIHLFHQDNTSQVLDAFKECLVFKEGARRDRKPKPYKPKAFGNAHPQAPAYHPTPRQAPDHHHKKNKSNKRQNNTSFSKKSKTSEESFRNKEHRSTKDDRKGGGRHKSSHAHHKSRHTNKGYKRGPQNASKF